MMGTFIYNVPTITKRKTPMKNKLIDLNDHLFAQLERLNDEDLKGEALKDELHRSKGVVSVAGVIVGNAKLALEVEQFKNDLIDPENRNKMPKMLGSNHD